MKMEMIKKRVLLIAISAIFVISGCTKSSEGTGRLSVKVTDDPFNINFVESATVKINKIEIGNSGQDTNKFIVLMQDTLTFDLMQLRNGITQEITNIDIPQGNYNLIRLYVVEASLKLKDQADAFKVKVPSGSQTGIKILISPSLSVAGGLTAEVLLDFDLSKSFVMRGNMQHSAGVNGFIFKPVIKATNNTTAGRIEGQVTDTASAAIENAKVWIAKDTVISTAFTDLTGHYAIIGVPAGTYSIFATKENYDTLTYPDVVITEGNKTIENFILHQK